MLDGKRILITGILNNRSIAYAIAREARAQGANIALTYQDNERFRAKVAKLAESDLGNPPLYPLDVSSEDQCKALADSVRKDFGSIDGLVHSVAYADRATLAGAYHEATSREHFSQALDISAYSLTALAAHLAPLINAGGSIVTLTYIGSRQAIPNYNVMGVAKAALESSVRYLAASLGPANIRVNAISAGPIKTLAASGISDLGKMLDAVAASAPLQRNVSQNEVASAAAFMLSSAASGITGEILHVDAGQHISPGMLA